MPAGTPHDPQLPLKASLLVTAKDALGTHAGYADSDSVRPSSDARHVIANGPSTPNYQGYPVHPADVVATA